ncbi:YkgJ family cysteine cluster protein [Desulforhopalus singaporensis]|uniref:Putative zinc-or iron-chelating domain-containing protein n=1 Tax=Desulforhopalus singaporensis TaxID=91360 RepID=A0A1H0UGK4_9BACT|nr:YkgJ family cysteine cluster protein [Desulforhopalus singaporensis]SDP65263.1 Putative zinc-or iron-chelating domain-containing protein [Desulforhopalus singaporensis]
MFAKLTALYDFVDQTVQTVHDRYPTEVKCRPGCADCCHALFDISFIEAARLAAFLVEHKEIITEQRQRANEAACQFERLMTENSDPSTARVRCPLLSDSNLCLAHEVRPINCRTYGTPTEIDGKAHVCGLSGFTGSTHYPTVKLEPLQQSLTSYSKELVGPTFGARRFPIAWVILKTSFFLPSS